MNKLTFGELDKGDKFIAFPTPGDNAGHGGYKGSHVLFKKLVYTVGDEQIVSAKSVKHKTESSIPYNMEVIKIV